MTFLRSPDGKARLTIPTGECRICSKAFVRMNSMQIVCGGKCGLQYARAARVDAANTVKAQRRADKKRLQELNPKHQASLTQDVVNDYVRLRDAHLGCVSCDLPASWDGRWNASHFRSRGAASGLRFHLWNNHKSCWICNQHKSGNAAEYEIRLRARIGDEKVDWLKSQNQTVRYSVAYLIRLRAVIAKKTRRLAKARELSNV